MATELTDALAVTADFTDDDAAPLVVGATLERFGAIDVVVNNAGINRVISAIDDTPEGFRHELQVDLVGPYDLARRSARWMIENERPGSIVNIASVIATVAGGPIHLPGYAAAKGGLANLTKEEAPLWVHFTDKGNTQTWLLARLESPEDEGSEPEEKKE